MPWPALGAPVPDIVQPGDKDFPVYPLVVQDDIPLCLVRGYILGGMPEFPASHIDYCKKNCVFRGAPLHPTGSPLAAVEAICHSDRWHRVFANKDTASNAQLAVRLQAMRAVANIFGTVPEDLTRRFQRIRPRRFEQTWKSCLEDERLTNSAWDGSKFIPPVSRATGPSTSAPSTRPLPPLPPNHGPDPAQVFQ
jgi:hypothetical protein